MYFMKTTLDLSDDLYAMVKARAALEGRTLRSVMEELLKEWVGAAVPESPEVGSTAGGVRESRVAYGKGRSKKDRVPASPVSADGGPDKHGGTDSLDAHREHLGRIMRNPRALDEIAGVLAGPGPDMDMSKIREIYAQRLAEEWKNRHP